MKKGTEIPPAALEALRSSEAAAKAAAEGQPVTAKTIRLHLTMIRWKKLSALAEAERMTVSEVLWRFIDACQPGGGGWEAPAAKTKRREREERGGE